MSSPFAGIATFLKSPYIPKPVTNDGEVAVLGVPYDEAVTSRAGTREGPRALRIASANWAYRDGVEPYRDGELGADLLGGVRFLDAGDVELAPTAPAEISHPRIADGVAVLMCAGLFPVILGGDHSITYPVLQGVSQARAEMDPTLSVAKQAIHLVQFDTHMDYWDTIDGQPLTHGSPMIRSHEAGFAGRITQYGIRGLHATSDNVALAGERGVVTHWCEVTKHRLRESHVDELVGHIRPDEEVWITFDIDCLDPAIAPGTGTPEPGGFSYYEAKALLLAVAGRARVVGMDLVEVNPLYDPGQLAALHGARLILDAVGAVFEARRRST